MIKGDLRKKQILETAEALFSEKGYEATGVQDILDVLHLSKGSFYHHFVSKEQVLQIICENRAALAAARINQASFVSGLQRMNALLKSMIPFQGEGLAFIKMILPVFALPEGNSIIFAYQNALKNCWMSSTAEALSLMISQGDAYTLYPEKTAGIALDLVNDLWCQLGKEMILSEKKTRSQADPGSLLTLVEPYRPAVENLFSAPYGSLELLNLQELVRLTEEIHDWWMVKPEPCEEE